MGRSRIEIQRQIFFDYNESVIREESYGILNRVAEVLEENDHIHLVEIQGHTDHIGGSRFNQGLSERRAQAVKEFLVQAGVDAGRLRIRGFGQSEPIASNETEEGRSVNRRVEFHIIEQEIASDAPVETF